MQEHVHIVINTHDRLPLIRCTIPRIIAATKSTAALHVTHSVYDDQSDDPTRDYLLSLLDAREIDNLILDNSGMTERRALAQQDNPCVANYLQILRACLFIGPAEWILHFTDDALISFRGNGSNWLSRWIDVMRSEPRIVSMQMTDYDINIMCPLDGTALGLPSSVKLHRTNFVSDRYTLYRYSDLLRAFEDFLTHGQYPGAFEAHLNAKYSVDNEHGRWAVVCQWDDEYIGTHIGPTSGAITFTDHYVRDLHERLDLHGPNLSLSERVEFS